MLSSFGSNSHGQLGLGHYDDQTLPQNLAFFQDKDVLFTACGAEHSLVQTSDELYSFGCNDKGQLGLGHNKHQPGPQRLGFFQNKEILFMSCGAAHSLILTTEALYSFGRNEEGQLGLGHFKNQNMPQKAVFFRHKKILAMSCGASHSLVLTSDGLYSFGCKYSIPQKVSFFEKKRIWAIACGANHSLVLTSESLYSFGRNDNGQLGLGHKINQNSPQKVTFLNPTDVRTICCGANYSLVQTSDGLYFFGPYLPFSTTATPATTLRPNPRTSFIPSSGSSRSSPFPAPSASPAEPTVSQVLPQEEASTSPPVSLPLPLSSPPPLSLKFFGHDVSSPIDFPIISPPELNSEQHNNNNNNNTQNMPQRISFFDEKEIVFINCGADHCMIQTADALYSFGSNDKGQLGLGYYNDNEIRLTRSINVTDHSSVLSSDGMYSFGYTSSYL